MHDRDKLNSLSKQILEACICVHKELVEDCLNLYMNTPY